MSRLEILAPAGGPEALTAAVRAGADAVYLGASRFSARASAHNFDDAQLREAVEYCHLCGTDVHLAVNTLIHDDEIEQAMSVVEYACEIGVDALIVQDTGLISLIRRCAPDMPVHGSTQMSVHTLKGVELMAEMGLTRAVLSRELSFEEIRRIVRSSPIEIEVFVHGALCMSVSGQCYFSAMLGSRSGNRGSCAQPCRLPFSVRGGTGHDLSLKDMSVITHLRELEEIGVASAKIEGRMKRPEYVAAAVDACRQSLDKGAVDPSAMQRLEAVFSRSGFTDGYYKGKRGLEMFGIRSKENVTSADSAVFGSIHELYKRERQSVPVKMLLTVRENEKSSLKVTDDKGNCAAASGDVPEKAERVFLDKERCEKSLCKTGGTPFSVSSLECQIDPGLMLPASSLNQLRSVCLEKLSGIRREIRSVKYCRTELKEYSPSSSLPDRYRVRFTDDDIPEEFLDAELIYVPLTLSSKKLDAILEKGFAVAVEVPRGIFGIEEKIIKELRRVQSLGINELLANNIAAVKLGQELGMDIHGGFGLNLTNTQSLVWAAEQGMLDAELSFELTLQQIVSLGKPLPTGIITSGRLPLMLCRNCPAKNDTNTCHNCRTAPVLTDRKGIGFPMKCYGSCTEILNSVPLFMGDRKTELRGIDFEIIRFSTENHNQKLAVLKSFVSGNIPQGGHTRGLYYRGVE